MVASNGRPELRSAVPTKPGIIKYSFDYSGFDINIHYIDHIYAILSVSFVWRGFSFPRGFCSFCSRSMQSTILSAFSLLCR